MKDEIIICNRYNKRYILNNNIEIIIRYLRVEYSIDLKASSIAKKRIRDKIIINIAILREIKINREA